MDISEKIKIIIQDSGLSLPKFAHRIGVSKNTLINYRDGKTSPSIDFIEKVCKEFLVNPTSLILDEGDFYLNREIMQFFVSGKPINIDENDCLNLLVIEAMRKAGVILTPHGLEKMRKLIRDGMWDEIKDGIVGILKSLVKIMPRWESKNQSQPKG